MKLNQPLGYRADPLKYCTYSYKDGNLENFTSIFSKYTLKVKQRISLWQINHLLQPKAAMWVYWKLNCLANGILTLADKWWEQHVLLVFAALIFAANLGGWVGDTSVVSPTILSVFTTWKKICIWLCSEKKKPFHSLSQQLIYGYDESGWAMININEFTNCYWFWYHFSKLQNTDGVNKCNLWGQILWA